MRHIVRWLLQASYQLLYLRVSKLVVLHNQLLKYKLPSLQVRRRLLKRTIHPRKPQQTPLSVHRRLCSPLFNSPSSSLHNNPFKLHHLHQPLKLQLQPMYRLVLLLVNNQDILRKLILRKDIRNSNNHKVHIKDIRLNKVILGIHLNRVQHLVTTDNLGLVATLLNLSQALTLHNSARHTKASHHLLGTALNHHNVLVAIQGIHLKGTLDILHNNIRNKRRPHILLKVLKHHRLICQTLQHRLCTKDNLVK